MGIWTVPCTAYVRKISVLLAIVLWSHRVTLSASMNWFWYWKVSVHVTTITLTLQIKTIMSILKILTYIITSITACPIRLAAINTVSVSIFKTAIYTIKPAHVAPLSRSHLYQKVTFFLSCHRKFHMNWTSFKRSPVLKGHFFFVLKVTS